jgi:hypothetical protein
MRMETKAHPRPYWHVDLKWIFGIILFFSLIVASVSFALATITSPKIAIDGGAYIVAGQFSKNGIDDPTDIEKLKQQYAALPDTVIYPLGNNKDISITKQELNTLSPRQIRLKIFRQVVEPIYKQKMDDKTAKQYGALAVLNENTHKFLQSIFTFTLIPVVLAAAGMIFFSYRYGRLVSPAVVLLMVSTLPSFIVLVAQHARPPQNGDKGPFGGLPPEVISQIASSLAPLFHGMFLTALALLAAVVILKIVNKIRSRSKHHGKNS